MSRVRGAAVDPDILDNSELSVVGNNRTAAAIADAPIRWQSDERWARDLPWAVQTISLSEVMWNLACRMILSTLLIVLPVRFVCLVFRRQFSLKTVLGLPIVAGLFLLAMFMEVPIDEDVHTLGERLAMAILYAPFIGSIGFVVWWIVDRRWRRVFAWLIGTIVVSSIVAGVTLWFDAFIVHPMLPEEEYRYQGWPLIWLIGTFATAWLLLLALSGTRLLGWIRNRLRSRWRPNELAL